MRLSPQVQNQNGVATTLKPDEQERPYPTQHFVRWFQSVGNKLMQPSGCLGELQVTAFKAHLRRIVLSHHPEVNKNHFHSHSFGDFFQLVNG